MTAPSDTEAPSAPEAQRGAPARRWTSLRRPRLGLALLGTALLGVGFSPTARVPIIADDFQALQETYAVSDGSLVEAIRFGLEQGTLGGHFNPVGQALGATYHWSLYAVSATLHLDPQNLDVLGGFALLWLAVAGAVAVLHTALQRGARAGSTATYWPLFAVSAAFTACTLQLHAPWSNDPVVSYAPAGFGSAALGFALLALVLRATDPGSRWMTVLAASVLSICCVWYYEMLIAAVVGVAALVSVLVVTARGPSARAERRRGLVVLGTTVLLPAVLFLGSRRLAVPQTESSYDGTALALGGDALRTWGIGIRGSLPTAAWGFVEDRTGVVRLTGTTILIALLLALGLGLLVRALRGHRVARPAQPRFLVAAVVGLVTFWGLATASHAVTRKYIDELQEVGQVYLFYAVGVVVVATVAGPALLALWQTRSGHRLLVVLSPVMGVLLLAQVSSNMTVAREVESVIYPANGRLVALSVEPGSDPSLRCSVLAEWRAGSWPDYYRKAVSDGVQENFARVYGQPFCPPAIAQRLGIPAPAQP